MTASFARCAPLLALWLALAVWGASLPLLAQGQPVIVSDAWVRATVAQQRASGAFMQIRAVTAARIVGVTSPVAGVSEIHEMAMDGNVMRMRAVPALELSAGKTVEFKPGGYHVMLMDLKKPLNAGDAVPITLVIEAGGKREKLDFSASVRSLSGSAAAAVGASAPAPTPSHKH